MAATIKAETESDVDPLSTQTENDLIDIEPEQYLIPVVMTENEYITSDIKAEPDFDIDSSEPMSPPARKEELFEMIFDENPVPIITSEPENVEVHICGKDPHRKSASRRQNHACTFCRKTFNRKQHLTDHTRMHTLERPYTCDLCKKSFSRKGYLKVHLRLHRGHQPYSCKFCKKSFNQKSQLETHVYVHTGDGPYSCDVCSKSYSDRINLILHQRVHSDL